VSSRPSWKTPIIDEEEEIHKLPSITHSTSILEIQYVPDKSTPRLIVGFSHRIIILNPRNFDVVFKLNMGNDFALSADAPSVEQPIPFASAYHFCFGENDFVVSSSKMAQSSTVFMLVDPDTKMNIPRADPIPPFEEEELGDYVKRIVALQLKGNWAGKQSIL
jgi:hypothetical protein